jgi:hypothetical protein
MGEKRGKSGKKSKIVRKKKEVEANLSLRERLVWAKRIVDGNEDPYGYPLGDGQARGSLGTSNRGRYSIFIAINHSPLTT